MYDYTCTLSSSSVLLLYTCRPKAVCNLYTAKYDCRPGLCIVVISRGEIKRSLGPHDATS